VSRIAALLLLAVCATSCAAAGGAVVPSPSRTTTAAVVATHICTRPAPDTAAGYTAMFAALDTREWGGADIAVSVPVGGRSVWLFGDTLSSGLDGRGRFVHSTAITQQAGCLHVSHAGAQLLPDEHQVAVPTRADPSRIYWIQSGAAVGPDTLTVTARAIDIVGTGPWDFRDGGASRTALATVDEAGDVTFVRWLATAAGPAPDPGPMIDCEAPRLPAPHHICYGRRGHPELSLAGGHTLVTVSQNWDDGVLHPLHDYQPVFSASPERAHH
jgi:hypothetical protein